ncbi:JmjC domain, hydroxylase-domain-containing protein [Mycena metata]|uniref:JmjC domain, hydroxylase-domain-containing protein n=1 Tax=Mycena metata TaxID=1033252 RepID=A0AAD7JB69_9AGAR|nr:JmjC domain, hydroxylase-domain-containing protein [Mycena metata]
MRNTLRNFGDAQTTPGVLWNQVGTTRIAWWETSELGLVPRANPSKPNNGASSAKPEFHARQGPGRAAQQPQCPARTSHPSQEGPLKALDRARGTGQHRNGLAPEYRLPRPGGHKAHADADADANDADNTSPKKPQRNRSIERADKDASFLDSFVPHKDWLPPDTVATDYTPEFCAKLKRVFWRNCGLARPAWHGAVTMGSLFTPATTAWNVATLPSTLSRLLPPSSGGLPGVNTPFGMWRATFAWHAEDMDLFSINYIHFGAPKFWYAVPQGRAGTLEGRMRGYFPADTSTCPQFLQHKSFLASPSLLSQSAVRPNHLVQHAGEFVVTFPGDIMRGVIWASTARRASTLR